MDILAELIGGLSSAFGANQYNNQANQEEQLQQQQVNQQQGIMNYLLNQRQNVTDPIWENTVLPALTNRVNAGPSAAGLVNTDVNRLTTPFHLSYNNPTNTGY